jgi:hypothetical protein
MRGPVPITIQAGDRVFSDVDSSAADWRASLLSFLSAGASGLIGRSVLISIRIFHRYSEERVVGKNEQRTTVGPAKDDVNGTLGHIDLAD